MIRAISTPMVSGRVDRLDARYPVNEPTLERVLVLVSTFVDLCVSVTRIGGAGGLKMARVAALMCGR
ncbi:hypothetical protein D2E70_20250 [Mycobacteroides abscessus]|nr:hypothetical protein [Mycobacteroides abscessus]RIS68234.1 hypothetical protein D2E70_20250 [Mycobacteroides abscessus]